MNNFLNDLNIKPYKYNYINKALIIYSDKIYVLKKNSHKDKTYKYLDGISFDNFIKPIKKDNLNYLFNYLEDYSPDSDSKMINLVEVLSVLHSKTSEFKELNLDRVKEIVEKCNEKINYLEEYYNNLEDTLNESIFYKPYVYTYLRNVSKIYYNLDFSKYLVKLFYDEALKNNKYKESLILGKVRADNFINDKFTNFDHSTFKSPIYDLIDLYKEYYDSYDFQNLYKVYKSNYHLNKLEELYFFLMISILYKISFKSDSYTNTLNVHKLMNYIDRTRVFIVSNNKVYEKNNDDEEKKQ